jgi:sugar-specific transcriptional regulator TrmB
MGSGIVSTIARKAGAARTNCYYTLKTLVGKGLVSITNQKHKQLYIAETPRKLVVAQRKQLAIAESLVPTLVALERTVSGLRPRMRYYEGQAGISNLLMQSLESKGILLVYTHNGMFSEKFSEMLAEYCNTLTARRIRMRVISPYSVHVEHFIDRYFPNEDAQDLLELLYLNYREFSLESHVMIYNDTVSMISLAREENIGVTIESRAYADTSRATFNLAWLGATSFVAQ